MLMVLMATVMMNGGPKEQPGCCNVGFNHHAYTHALPTRAGIRGTGTSAHCPPKKKGPQTYNNRIRNFRIDSNPAPNRSLDMVALLVR